MTPPSRSGAVFIHPSDELYGADRMLLEMLDALPREVSASSECWLPIDLPHSKMPLCVELERRGVALRHLDLPILRRAYRSPIAFARLLRRMRAVRSELCSRRPQLVYCTTSATFLNAPVARSAGVPLVIGHVQEIWSRLDRCILGVLGRSCHRMAAISRATVEPLPRGLQRRTVIIPNATPRARQVMSLDGRTGPLTFLVASRWNSWKGHQTLLAAWDRLQSDARLVVLGGPPSSGEAVDVAELAAALRRPETVTIVGEVSDVAQHIDQADVVVVPSDEPEPFGLLAIEAFARGRPVVGSAAGGLLDVVTSGRDGWLYPPRDAVALSCILEHVSREQVIAAGAEARTTYERRFTTERYVSEWRRLVDLDRAHQP